MKIIQNGHNLVGIVEKDECMRLGREEYSVPTGGRFGKQQHKLTVNMIHYRSNQKEYYEICKDDKVIRSNIKCINIYITHTTLNNPEIKESNFIIKSEIYKEFNNMHIKIKYNK